jgi:hypothetical protein
MPEEIRPLFRERLAPQRGAAPVTPSGCPQADPSPLRGLWPWAVSHPPPPSRIACRPCRTPSRLAAVAPVRRLMIVAGRSVSPTWACAVRRRSGARAIFGTGWLPRLAIIIRSD